MKERMHSSFGRTAACVAAALMCSVLFSGNAFAREDVIAATFSVTRDHEISLQRIELARNMPSVPAAVSDKPFVFVGKILGKGGDVLAEIPFIADTRLVAIDDLRSFDPPPPLESVPVNVFFPLVATEGFLAVEQSGRELLREEFSLGKKDAAGVESERRRSRPAFWKWNWYLWAALVASGLFITAIMYLMIKIRRMEDSGCLGVLAILMLVLMLLPITAVFLFLLYLRIKLWVPF